MLISNDFIGFQPQREQCDVSEAIPEENWTFTRSLSRSLFLLSDFLALSRQTEQLLYGFLVVGLISATVFKHPFPWRRHLDATAATNNVPTTVGSTPEAFCIVVPSFFRVRKPHTLPPRFDARVAGDRRKPLRPSPTSPASFESNSVDASIFGDWWKFVVCGMHR